MSWAPCPSRCSRRCSTATSDPQGLFSTGSRVKRTSEAPIILLALSVITMWGFSFVAIEVALRHVGPGQLVVLRFLPSLLALGLIALPRLAQKQRRIERRDLLVLAIAGLFGVIVYNLALNTGQTFLPASLAALVIALNPASIAIVAALWLGEIPAPRTWVGLIVALAGILVVVLGRHGTPEVRLHHLAGVAITLGAPVSWGIFTTSLRRTGPRTGAFNASLLAILFGSLPLVLAVDGELIATVRQAPPTLIAAVLFLALGCTVYGFTMWAVVLKRMEAARAGAFIYLVPLIAAFGSYAMLGEPVDLPLVLGGVIVLVGVGLATGRLRWPAKQRT